MRKFQQIAEIIRSRIDRGDYPAGVLDGLRPLATEFGVNYLTVRKALHHLCEMGLLRTAPNRRFEVIEQNRSKPAGGQHALILPMGALNFGLGRQVARAVAEAGGRLRTYVYSFYEDEVIASTLDGPFDLVFFMIDPRQTPDIIVRKIVEHRDRAVSLVFDYTTHGVRLLAEAPITASVDLLLERFIRPAHGRLDILGVSHDNEIISERIACAERWAKRQKMTHMCLRKNVPEFSYEFEIAEHLAREVYGGGLAPDAIFVPTVYAAMATMRVLKDLGHAAGRDYSLVSCEDLLFARYAIPSLTVSYTPEDPALVSELLAGTGAAGNRRMVFRPSAPSLFIGESTRIQK